MQLAQDSGSFQGTWTQHFLSDISSQAQIAK